MGFRNSVEEAKKNPIAVHRHLRLPRARPGMPRNPFNTRLELGNGNLGYDAFPRLSKPTGGFLCRILILEIGVIFHAAVYPYAYLPCIPSGIPTHAVHVGLIFHVVGPVASVLTTRDDSDVLSAVVEAVVILMIDLHIGGRVQQNSVHQHDFPFAVRIANTGLRVECIPSLVGVPRSSER